MGLNRIGMVGSNSFWREGEVTATEYLVPFTGTWEQCAARSEEMAGMEQQHYAERNALRMRQLAERKTLWEVHK